MELIVKKNQKSIDIHDLDTINKESADRIRKNSK
jgi:hypothetical protein